MVYDLANDKRSFFKSQQKNMLSSLIQKHNEMMTESGVLYVTEWLLTLVMMVFRL